MSKAVSLQEIVHFLRGKIFSNKVFVADSICTYFGILKKDAERVVEHLYTVGALVLTDAYWSIPARYCFQEKVAVYTDDTIIAFLRGKTFSHYQALVNAVADQFLFTTAAIHGRVRHLIETGKIIESGISLMEDGTMHQSYTCPESKYPNYAVAGVGVLIYRIHEGREQVLLLKRKKAPDIGYWTNPGGKIEYLERAMDAGVREVYEEVGLHISSMSFLCHVDHIDLATGHHCQGPAFVSQYSAGNVENKEPEKHQEVKWFYIDEIPRKLTVPTQEALLAWLSKNPSRMDLYRRRYIDEVVSDVKSSCLPEYLKEIKPPQLLGGVVRTPIVPIKEFIHKFCKDNPLSRTGAIFVVGMIKQGKLLQTLLSSEVFPDDDGVVFYTMKDIREEGFEGLSNIVNNPKRHRYVIVTAAAYSTLIKVNPLQPVVYVSKYRIRGGSKVEESVKKAKTPFISKMLFDYLKYRCLDKDSLIVLPSRFWEV